MKLKAFIDKYGESLSSLKREYERYKKAPQNKDTQRVMRSYLRGYIASIRDSDERGNKPQYFYDLLEVADNF